MKTTDPLQTLKDAAIANIQPYIPQAGRKNFIEAKTRITHSTTEKEVLGYYSAWRQKLAFKNIATLPDLNKPATRNPTA